MTRRAILIAASPPSNAVPGVFADVDAWYSFLQSSSGGRWNPQELLVAKNTSRESLLIAIESASQLDYALIVFAGHGRSVTFDLPWPEAEVHLFDGSTMTERDLNPATPRCTIIFDCCRGLNEEEEGAGFLKNASLLLEGQDPVKHRAFYDATLYSAESGLVKIYSTGVVSAAADYQSFSQQLLFQASQWASSNRGVLSIQSAVNMAATALARNNQQQKPEYHGGRRLRHFPFAVSI